MSLQQPSNGDYFGLASQIARDVAAEAVAPPSRCPRCLGNGWLVSAHTGVSKVLCGDCGGTGLAPEDAHRTLDAAVRSLEALYDGHLADKRRAEEKMDAIGHELNELRERRLTVAARRVS